MKKRVNLPRKPRGNQPVDTRKAAAMEAAHVARKKQSEIIRREHAKKSALARAWQKVWSTLKFGVVLFLTQWSGR